MQSYHINKYSSPNGYELGELARPLIEHPSEVLIKVSAASVNPVDVKMADGMMKALKPLEFPFKLGYDCAGTVTEVGSGVTRFKTGDEVYVRLPESTRGAWSEYAKSPESYVSLKPTNLSFDDAASIPLAAQTALEALQMVGDLEGKTVFVPAGLSATGAFCCQLAKNVFKAGKVITTVSTAKIPQVGELLGEGVVDQIIDYTKQNPMKEIPAGSVDFVFDTVGIAMPSLSLVRPGTGHIISIATTPRADQMQHLLNQDAPFLFRHVLNLMDTVRQWRAWHWGVNYSYLMLNASSEKLDLLKEYIEEGKLKPVVGSRVHYKDVNAVREACTVVYNGKGGIGKTVISFD